MPQKRGINRRKFIGATVGAGLLLGGVGQGGATSHSPSIEIDNGAYFVEVGAAESDNWVFGQSDDLYSEEFAVSEGTLDTTWASDGTVTDGFPVTGSPGTRYEATVEIPVGETTVAVERGVRLHSSRPSLRITYQVTNVGEAGVRDLRLFQYMDYDIDDDTSDNGDYVPDPEHVYQEDVGSGQGVGFTGSLPADRYDVEQYGSVDGYIDDGELPNRDWDFQGEDDIAAALQWNFGALAPGESTDQFTVQFAAGNSREDVESLLEVGNVTSVSGWGSQEIGPPQDCDGDGLYEDVNGDGEVNHDDLRALLSIILRYQNSQGNSLSEQEAARFDFNEDGKLDMQDFFTLRTQIENGTACDGDGGGEEDGGDDPVLV